ncbi:MAG: flagellar biosynthesis protein FlhB [Betaproteobacteria bacterium]
MAEENDQERTEEASEQRLEKAREDGHVARSQELTTFAMMAAAAAGLWWMGGQLFHRMSNLVREGLRIDAATAFDPTQMMTRMNMLSIEGLMTIAPFLLLLLVVALAAPQLLSGWLFSTEALRFDFSRIDPMAGIGRVFSWRGVGELIKALLKSALVGLVGALIVWHYREPLLHLASLPLEAGIVELGRIVGSSFLMLAGVLAVVAVADVPFQLWRHADELKMSREELRQEMKESDGNPEMKAAIRAQQREMARRRMMAEVPNASVIVTNPTHYAVALRYDETMRAPRVVAKGADLIAAKIRELGAEHHVPVLEAPALARAIFRHAEINEEVPAQLYTAVAEVLAYVFQLNSWREHGGLVPHPLPEIAVPAGMDPNEVTA